MKKRIFRITELEKPYEGLGGKYFFKVDEKISFLFFSKWVNINHAIHEETALECVEDEFYLDNENPYYELNIKRLES